MKLNFRLAPLAMLALGLALGTPALAKDKAVKQHYVEAASVDLTQLLPPPPDEDSAAEHEDLAAVMSAQQARTADQVAAARADAARSVFRFADVIGPEFTAENLPLTAALFRHVDKDGRAVVDPAKKFWHRRRPFLVSTEIHPAVELPNSASYPSEHSTFVTLTAILLADMVPEKRHEIFARAEAYAHNRVVGGVHFPSDIEAGRLAGTVIAETMLENRGFRKDFKAAEAELRTTLGLPPGP